MKPLFFDYPADQATYSIDDEWLLGDSLLAAPMLSDQTSRNIHVPAGQWFDVGRHRVINGPADLSGYTAGLGATPAFVRLGTPDTGELISALSERFWPSGRLYAVRTAKTWAASARADEIPSRCGRPCPLHVIGFRSGHGRLCAVGRAEGDSRHRAAVHHATR